MKIKICGLKHEENIIQIAKLNPDFIGFIFYPDSKRYVGQLLDSIDLGCINQTTKTVGVFVNEPLDSLFEKVGRYHLDYVQLHGNEPVSYCAEAISTGISVIKAFGISNGFDFGVLTEYELYCRYFLFDTLTEQYGGSGNSFDWSVLRQYKNTLPFFLSGGIDLPHVQSIVKFDNPKLWAIDINSKFEIEPGIKNIEKVKQLIKTINYEFQCR